MAIIRPLLGKTPQWGENCFFAENAVLIGDVVMGDNCSIWYNAVLRGDVHFIKMGNNVNVQDGAVIHGSHQKASTTIGDYVSIGHNAVVHGCTLHNNLLVGMGAIVMDNAVVEEYTIIAAGAVVLQNTVVESGWIYAGVPAKKVKKLSDEERHYCRQNAVNYLMYKDWYNENP